MPDRSIEVTTLDNTAVNPQLSVMILTRNRLDVARKCLESVLWQGHPSFEVVILDDASDSGDTAAALATEFPDSRIRHFRSETSLGVAGGRNFLMENSRGDIVISIDDDAIFTKSTDLEEVSRAFRDRPEVGIVAFRITNVINGERSPLVPFHRVTVQRNPEVVVTPAMVSTFRGGGHAIRKELINRLGAYRRDMMFGEEEMDLAYRAIQHGYRIAYEPSINIDHFPMPSVTGGGQGHRAFSELYYHVRNRSYLAYRYLPVRYLLPYIGFWMTQYTIRSVRTGTVFDLVRGLLATPGFLRGVRREVLDRNALAYLTKHGGRLWY